MSTSISLSGSPRDRLISAAHNLVDLLNMEGIPAYISNQAQTGSAYIRIKDCDTCRQLRISDHPGRPKYRYKFNLILSQLGVRSEEDDGITRHYYGVDSIEQLVVDLKHEYESRKNKE